MTVAGVADIGNRVVFLQGIAVGDTTLTVTAPGFETAVLDVSVDPGGFVIRSPAGISNGSANFTTNTTSANSALRITPVVMDRNTLAPENPTFGVWTALRVRAGTTASVPVISSNPAVGAIIMSPVIFNGNDATLDLTTEFDPLTVGSTAVTAEAPAGYTQPGEINSFRSQLTVTVE